MSESVTERKRPTRRRSPSPTPEEPEKKVKPGDFHDTSDEGIAKAMEAARKENTIDLTGDEPVAAFASASSSSSSSSSSSAQCIICCDEDINICVVPCGHMFCGVKCADRLKQEAEAKTAKRYRAQMAALLRIDPTASGHFDLYKAPARERALCSVCKTPVDSFVRVFHV